MQQHAFLCMCAHSSTGVCSLSLSLSRNCITKLPVTACWRRSSQFSASSWATSLPCSRAKHVGDALHKFLLRAGRHLFRAQEHDTGQVTSCLFPVALFAASHAVLRAGINCDEYFGAFLCVSYGMWGSAQAQRTCRRKVLDGIFGAMLSRSRQC